MSTINQAFFSVYHCYEEDIYEKVRDHVCAREASRVVVQYCNSVAAHLGITKKVVITAAGDCVVFEWRHGEGVVFPTREN